VINQSGHRRPHTRVRFDDRGDLRVAQVDAAFAQARETLWPPLETSPEFVVGKQFADDELYAPLRQGRLPSYRV